MATFVYSNKITRFIEEVKGMIKEILVKNVGLRVTGYRFYDARGEFSYPIKVVIYNNKSMLGYFDSDFFELGFHESLMHQSKNVLLNVIKHEIGHYLTFIQHGETEQAHGHTFRTLCQKLGWGEEIYRATICLEEEQTQDEIKENSILRKIQKLMSLASSSNQNEAEQAMLKSQQLLLKHNIDATYLDGEDEEQMVLKRILKQKRENAKMRAIGKILETFFVSTVFNRAGDFTYLEILGTATNIEIAEYVAGFLETEFEKQWYSTKLKGAIAKNSFFLGIAKGYCSKVHSLKRSYSTEISTALVVIEKKLSDARDMAYQRLTSTKSHSSYCHTSSLLGEKIGKQLTIHPVIQRPSKGNGALIEHHSNHG